MRHLIWCALVIALLFGGIAQAQESDRVPATYCWHNREWDNLTYQGQPISETAMTTLIGINGEDAWLGYPEPEQAETAAWGDEYGFRHWKWENAPTFVLELRNSENDAGVQMYASKWHPEIVWLFVYTQMTPGTDQNGNFYGVHPCLALLIDPLEAWKLVINLHAE